MKQPIIDMHCDLLSYLEYVKGADAYKPEIGANIPALKEGNVKLQVMAMYTATESGSTAIALKQSEIFKDLLLKYKEDLHLVKDISSLNTITTSSKIGIIASIENASGFCEEDEPLDTGFKKLEQIIKNTERILYIGFTHHGENRFGGGNMTGAGIKDDGKELLNYMSGKKIALDLSHTSDALAFGQLDHISKNNLDIPIIASHSNFRNVWNHKRNLTDELAKEIIKQNGLIGINFLRAFLNNEDPNAIYEHILYAIKIGAQKNICFGADYFFASEPDPARIPYYNKDIENAACYPAILKNLEGKVPEGFLEDISHENVINFLNTIWN